MDTASKQEAPVEIEYKLSTVNRNTKCSGIALCTNTNHPWRMHTKNGSRKQRAKISESWNRKQDNTAATQLPKTKMKQAVGLHTRQGCRPFLATSTKAAFENFQFFFLTPNWTPHPECGVPTDRRLRLNWRLFPDEDGLETFESSAFNEESG